MSLSTEEQIQVVEFIFGAALTVIGVILFGTPASNVFDGLRMLAVGTVTTGVGVTFALHAVGGADLVEELLQFIYNVFETTVRAIMAVFRWLDRQ